METLKTPKINKDKLKQKMRTHACIYLKFLIFINITQNINTFFCRICRYLIFFKLKKKLD